MVPIRKSLYKRKRYLFPAILLLAILVLYLFPSWTPSITDESGNRLAGSIAELKEVELGGVKQSILIRGENTWKPVLLFLHGGPGYPQIAYARKYQRLLEKEFIVVNWDQRGSGKSYRLGLSEEELKVERLVADTLELTQYLKEWFHQPKIYIAGHSWGSLLGVWAVQKDPASYYAYVGIGQVAGSREGERLSYEFVLGEARRLANKNAIRELVAIGPPPYGNPRKDMTLERKWVSAFGGSERQTDTYGDLMRGIFFSPEYTWLDGLRFAIGNHYSAKYIMPQIENANLLLTAPELQVPVYLCMGEYDYMTPTEAAYSYYEHLKAPVKRFIRFERSAHFPHFEEPERFAEWMAALKRETSP